MYNTGFINDRPIRLDVGKLRKSEEIKDPEIYKKDLQKIAFRKIDKWLSIHYPEKREEIFQTMSEYLH